MRNLVAAACVTAVIGAASQHQDPTRFRSRVDVVEFTVTVLDRSRHPIAGLTASDFEVRVDRTPRPLAAFAAVTVAEDTSSSSTWAKSVAPDVQTNRLASEGRLMVIVMDRSIPDGWPMQAARAIANAAVDRLGPADLAAVVFTAASSRKYSQGLTADRARLHEAANRILVGALQEPPLPAMIAGARGASQPGRALRRIQLASEELSGECMCGVCVPDALATLATELSGETTRQKSILFIGSDIAVAAQDPQSRCAPYIYEARERLSRALDVANITFHVVDPRGLEGLGETAELASPAGLTDQAANLFRQSSLAVLPDYTGGRLVLNNNTPAEEIKPIFDESRAYYVLAVARDTAKRGGENRHHVTIAVKRPDAIVRTRSFYYATDPKAGPESPSNTAAAALAELIPRADFSLQMNLVPWFMQGRAQEIRVLLGVESSIAGQLDVVIAAFDRVAKPIGAPLQQRLNVPPSVVAGASSFQWSSVLKLQPGSYEVRAAVAPVDGRRAASVIGYVDLPDPTKVGLALSGVLVEESARPTLRRVFGPDGAIECSVQVWDARRDQGTLAVRYLLRNDRGEVVSTGDVPRDLDVPTSNAFEQRRLSMRLPADPGRYVLTIEATEDHRSASRDVRIEVR